MPVQLLLIWWIGILNGCLFKKSKYKKKIISFFIITLQTLFLYYYYILLTSKTKKQNHFETQTHKTFRSFLQILIIKKKEMLLLLLQWCPIFCPQIYMWFLLILFLLLLIKRNSSFVRIFLLKQTNSVRWRKRKE